MLHIHQLFYTSFVMYAITFHTTDQFLSRSISLKALTLSDNLNSVNGWRSCSLSSTRLYFMAFITDHWYDPLTAHLDLTCNANYCFISVFTVYNVIWIWLLMVFIVFSHYIYYNYNEASLPTTNAHPLQHNMSTENELKFWNIDRHTTMHLPAM